jgi:diguanylate cyclase (GGDEF)-like protein
VFARDVTAQAGSANARRRAETLLGTVFDQVEEGLVLLGIGGDGRGRIRRANRAAQILLGREDLEGGRLTDLLTPGTDAETLAADFDRLLDGDRGGRGDRGGWAANGLERLVPVPAGSGHLVVRVSISLPHDGGEGGPEHALARLQDVTAEQAHQAWLARQPQTDPLTGLPDRLAMRERLNAEIRELRSGDGGLGVLMIDLDNFKLVNDVLGPSAGDDLLRRIATALTGLLPREAQAARIGGDEFVVLVPHQTESGAGSLGDRIAATLTEIGTTDYAGLLGVPVSASVGLRFTADPAVDPEELLRAADAAMYRLKQAKPRIPRPADPHAQNHLTGSI